MLKKALLFVLVAVVCVGLVGAAFAADVKRTNATQKGSLLFFPKIDTSLSTPILEEPVIYRDTIIMMGNDYYKQVWVKCYWMNAEQEIQDFMFPLTPNQPVWFRASDGLGTGYYDDVSNPITVPPFFAGYDVVGELKCWAVNAAGNNQISWNHLYGNAIVFDFYNGGAYEYNSWSFSTRGLTEGQRVGTEEEQGTLILSGNTGYYDACPKYVLSNFFAANANIAWEADRNNASFFVEPGTDLTVTPCKQDLRQDRIPTCSKLKFDIWNENETKYTGAYACFKCWYEDILYWPVGDNGEAANSFPVGKYGFEKFNYGTLHTTIGRFRTTGITSTVCAGFNSLCKSYVDTPVVAVTATPFVFDDGSYSLAGTNVFTAGNDPSGWVLWDPAYEPEDAAGR